MNMPLEHPIYILLGPTSSGKTSLAIELCTKLGGEIISADSRQICRYMDIGTGKIPVKSTHTISKNTEYWLIDGIKVWGYDLINPDEYFSSYDFVLFATTKAKDIINRGNKVFIVGGTGFYIDVFTGKRSVAHIKPDFDLRNILEAKTLEDLQHSLRQLNPMRFETIDVNNKSRLIRALELEHYLSTTPKSDVALNLLKDVRYEYIGLKSANEYLFNRVDAWVDSIWNNGLLEEAKNLLDLGFGDSARLQGLVYGSSVKFLKRELTEAEAIIRAKFDLHAYIRRQLTWFKKNIEIYWFDVANPNISNSVLNYMEQKQKNNYNSTNG